MRIGETGMAIAAYRETSIAYGHSGFAEGVSGSADPGREPPRPAERVIEGEVLGQRRWHWQGAMTTWDYLRLRGMQMADGPGTGGHGRAMPRLRADPLQEERRPGVLDFYV